MRQVFTTLGVLAAALGVTATAQPKATVDHRADEQAITKVLEDVQNAVNNYDATALAGLMATDGDLRSPDGELIHGRVAIEKYYAAAFTGRLKNVKVFHQPAVTIRYLTANIALIDRAEDLTGVMSTDGREISPFTLLISAIYVKRNGTWQGLSSRTWPANAIPGPAPAAGRKPS